MTVSGVPNGSSPRLGGDGGEGGRGTRVDEGSREEGQAEWTD